MIGSIVELQNQMAEQERRRQQFATQQAPAVAAPVAAGMPAAGYSAAPMALKAAEADVIKPGKGKRPPSVPVPEPEHIAWAKRVMADGYSATVKDRVDAGRILNVAGLNPDDFHGGKEPDSAPAGARAVAAAHLERDRAEADRAARKAYQDRGIHPGPGQGVTPGHPAPENFDRGYIEPGHAAESPQAEPARTNPNPVPGWTRGQATPVALPGAHVGVQHANLPDGPRAGRIPAHIQGHFSLGSPSEN